MGRLVGRADGSAEQPGVGTGGLGVNVVDTGKHEERAMTISDFGYILARGMNT